MPRSVTCNIINASVSGGQSSAVLAGYMDHGSVTRCSSTGSVSGTDYIGGLVGMTANGGISQSFSNVSVNGSGSHVGGLVGSMDGDVSDSYANGTVSGVNEVGGLIGSANGGSTTTNCYSTGNVSGTSSIGGFMGYAEAGDEMEMMPGATITNCFWDTEASGNATSAAGTSKTTAEMKDYLTFTSAGWDFKGESANGTNDIWNIGNSRNDEYPYLDWQYPGDDTPLPVTLAYFKAEAEQGRVMLSWRTESETENAVFRVYRNDAMIAELEGAGTTSEPQDYQWTDNYVIPGRSYTYVLADVDLKGKETKHPEIEVEIEVEDGTGRDFNIGAAYPNPFNPATVVPLSLTKDAMVSAMLYDITGRPLRELHNGTLSAGSHDLKIDGADLSTGVYLLHVRMNDAVHVQKIALMK